MNIEDLKITTGENSHQSARIELNDNMIDYSVNGELTYNDIVTISKGLGVISDFFDVNAVVTAGGDKIFAVALGKSLEDAFLKAIDGNSVEFVNAIVLTSTQVDSDVAKLLKTTNKIVAPDFTPNARKVLEANNVCYVKINTPLRDYKKYLMEDVKITPLGTLRQAPNLRELSKDTFKVVTKTKPSVEQVEDAVFAWKIAKYTNSRAVIIAKDLRTFAISQGLNTSAVEFALDYSCDMSKDAVLASDMPIDLHDINASAQGRVALIIVPNVSQEVINLADKFNISIITTGFTNILY